MTKEQITIYLQDAIAGFAHDPADTPFQRGYLAALEEVLEVITEVVK